MTRIMEELSQKMGQDLSMISCVVHARLFVEILTVILPRTMQDSYDKNHERIKPENGTRSFHDFMCGPCKILT